MPKLDISNFSDIDFENVLANENVTFGRGRDGGM